MIKGKSECKSDEDYHPPLSLSVVTLDSPTIYNNYADGYGEDAHETLIHGKVVNMQILKDGEPQIGIQINKDGTLVITDYASMCFQSIMPQNLHLKPLSGWDKEKC